MKHLTILLVVSMSVWLGGCLSPTPPPLPTPPPQEIRADRWWYELGDATLNTLADHLIRENLSLEMAKQRVLQSYATVHVKEAAFLPSVTMSGSGSVQNEIKGNEAYLDTYLASLSASYEVDLFGKKRDALSASENTFLSTFEALHISSISLIAELANTWYTLGYKQESLALLEEQRTVAHKVLAISKLKYESGKNSITDVWQQEQLIASLKAQITTLEGDIDAHKRAINLLLGRSVLEALPQASQAKLIALPSQPDVGIPATKLLNRPDVKQAYYTLAAANASLAEAIKNQYPSLNLSLSIGSLKTVTQFSDLLDTIIGTAMASISGTLFDGGTKEALVKQAHFLSKERSLNYKQVMLQAFGESQEALNREINTTLYLRQIEARITLAQNIFQRQREKYLLGVVDYNNVLSAEQSLYDLQQSHLSKQLERIKYRISLHRSLSGGFLNPSINDEWSSL